MTEPLAAGPPQLAERAPDCFVFRKGKVQEEFLLCALAGSKRSEFPGLARYDHLVSRQVQTSVNSQIPYPVSILKPA